MIRHILLLLLVFTSLGLHAQKDREKDSVILQPMPDEVFPLYATFLSANFGVGQFMTSKTLGFFNPDGVKNLSGALEVQFLARHRFQVSADHEFLYSGSRLNAPNGAVTYSASANEGGKSTFFNYRGGYAFVTSQKLKQKPVYRHPFSPRRKTKGVVGVMSHLHRELFVQFQYSRVQQEVSVGFDSTFMEEITGVAPFEEGSYELPIHLTVTTPSVIIGHSWVNQWKTYYFENGERVDRGRKMKFYAAITFAPNPPKPGFLYQVSDGRDPELVSIDPNYQLIFDQFFIPSNIGGFVGWEYWNFLNAPIYLSIEIGVRPGLTGNVSSGFENTLDFAYGQFKLGYKLEQLLRGQKSTMKMKM